MKRIHENASEVSSALERLVKETKLNEKLAQKAESNLSARNYTGVAINTDVDMLKVSKNGSVYLEESHSKELNIGGKHVDFGQIGRYVVIGRNPETGNLYMSNIVDSGSTPGAGMKDLGVSAPKSVSRIDLLIVKGKGFFNLGSNDAVIEVEDKF